MFAKFNNFIKNIIKMTVDLDRGNHHFKKEKFQVYLNEITHKWMVILYLVGFPTQLAFAFLDFIVIQEEIFYGFFRYRIMVLVSMAIAFFFIYKSRPSRFSVLYGYFISVVTAVMIGQMTVDLGGFNSSYYSGINVLIVGVNLFLPWSHIHSALNGFMIIMIYITMNLVTPHDFLKESLIDNLYFISSIVLATVNISYFHMARIKSEYILREDLHRIKDKLRYDLELAKRIQISLLPDHKKFRSYEIASLMLPSDEVGGDYFDLIEDEEGNGWAAIGDVSGHGMESGLVMMMANTIITTLVKTTHLKSPKAVLLNVNRILMNNITKLQIERYMTLVLMHLSGDKIVFAGRHLDLLVYRKCADKVEIISKKGAFMAMYEDIDEDLVDHVFTTEPGDIILLYTDGLTEADNSSGEMYGLDRLIENFSHNADKDPDEVIKLIIEEVFLFQNRQRDDISLMVMKRI